VRRIPSVLPCLIAEAAVLVLAAVRARSQEPEAAELAPELPRLRPCKPEEALARFRRRAFWECCSGGERS
jgi:hypothetical protein